MILRPHDMKPCVQVTRAWKRRIIASVDTCRRERSEEEEERESYKMGMQILVKKDAMTKEWTLTHTNLLIAIGPVCGGVSIAIIIMDQGAGHCVEPGRTVLFPSWV